MKWRSYCSLLCPSHVNDVSRRNQNLEVEGSWLGAWKKESKRAGQEASASRESTNTERNRGLEEHNKRDGLESLLYACVKYSKAISLLKKKL
jgi:hypothetical protein